ncbi:MAG: hypothetical protein JJK50_13645 [Komagataeibacter rhaeticus]|nr:hypothetical protein [Komagataeibacter rhaeticus]
MSMFRAMLLAVWYDLSDVRLVGDCHEFRMRDPKAICLKSMP